MKNVNPTPGNTPGLPAIHTKALRLSGILSAIAFLENENACAEGRSQLIFLAEELSEELTDALDALYTKEGRAA